MQIGSRTTRKESLLQLSDHWRLENPLVRLVARAMLSR